MRRGTDAVLEPALGVQAVRPAAAVRTAPARILVVDDDECMRELLFLHLSNEGHEVVLAEDALAAGKVVLEKIPDLMICDVSMPYMGGLELVSAIRADKTIPFFPVIFLSALTQGREQARGLGAAYLTKPVRADRLLSVISTLLPVRES